MRGVSIEERAVALAQYIIDSKDTVRGAAKKFGISKSTVHTDVTLKNGKNICRGRSATAYSFCNRQSLNRTSILGDPIPESIEIKGVFLSTKNPVVKLGLLIK